MPDHLDSVKDLSRTYRKRKSAAVERGDQQSAEALEEMASDLEAVVSELEQLRRATQPIPASYGDLSDLPPELVKELTGIKVDDLEEQLFTIIKSGDEVDLDAILIELFRRYRVVQTRKFLQNKLWRMVQKGIVYSVPKRKGVYTASERPDEFDEILGSPSPALARLEANVGKGWDDDLDDDPPF